MSTETSSHPIVAPIRREVRVACDVDTAFELFTAHLGAWWPVGTHSVFGARASVAFEDGVVVERLGADRAVWGTVLRWARPAGFAMTWHPGHGPDRATEVAVDFAADGDGTIVTLTHSGWERLGEPEQVRAEYERGWPVVLSGFEQLLANEPSATADRWFALEHRPGPLLAEGGSVFAHPLFAEHVAFLDRLAERGWLVAAGPVDAAAGTGMTVVRVPADVDVERTARDDDGSVRDGLLQVTVRPWDVRFTAR
ncbi:Activator of Hsp90 ATPase homolog 1-like protein [Pedococcus dokdonensis]|uniref:Activator of Hsp90 ATPase homolog 1-like protein n=1 Tax=Pedococcus dokdonensis TaxID=443156 RepID=A0A1H0TUL8_9MICO|nr:SRPBCC domain-containing protein [Pedococcus dokdonensis]SDP57435.1 Activator of Hsp90 ATPase homolog 1-like protein [Pedococcus dokdonensis]